MSESGDFHDELKKDVLEVFVVEDLTRLLVVWGELNIFYCPRCRVHYAVGSQCDDWPCLRCSDPDQGRMMYARLVGCLRKA